MQDKFRIKNLEQDIIFTVILILGTFYRSNLQFQSRYIKQKIMHFDILYSKPIIY